MWSRQRQVGAAVLALLGATDMAAALPQEGEDRPFGPLEEARSIDGSGNHLGAADLGKALTPFKRDASVEYGDGAGAPSGDRRPGARFVSNGAMEQSVDRPNAMGVSDLFWQWGQFLDHDITETPEALPSEDFPIGVPTGDLWFDPRGTGTQELPFSRSFHVVVDSRREQINAITSWIDGSQVYGSDDERAEALRTMDGTGRLKVSEGDLLPFNVDGLHNAPSDQLANFFLAGDVRANEQIGLISMHVLFVREHNYWAAWIAQEDADGIRRRRARDGGGGRGNGGRGGGRGLSRDDFLDRRMSALTGDEIYELARAMVSAEIQRVTYEEWLPLLLGAGALPSDSVYRPELNGSISNEFATAAFRFGHTMLSPTLLRLDARGLEIPEGHISLAGAFFAPQEIISTGIDPVLRGLVTQQAQELDMLVIDEIRNLLFGRPGAGGMDLPSRNIQRGRDHGLPSYAQVMRDLGMVPPSSLAQVSSDPDVVERLSRVARTPEDLDLWVGGLAEDHLPGALVGPTFHRILTQQFDALRDGDRLWHTRQLGPALLRMVERQSMESILARSSGLTRREAQRPFMAR